MKRVLLAVSLICWLLTLPCAAAGEDYVGELYGTLPSEVVQALPEEGELSASSLLDASFFVDLTVTTFQTALGECGTPLFLLGGCVVLASLLSTFAEGVGKESRSAVTFAAGLGITLAAYEVIRPLWEGTVTVLETIGLIIKSSLPVMTAIGGASGSAAGTAVNATWLSVLLALLEVLTESVLAPLFSICVGFLIVSSVSRGGGASELGGMVKAIRSVFLLLLSLTAAVLTAAMAFQSVLAKNSDTVLLRSVKFASGSAIPIIGGALSEAAGAYLSSLAVVRSTAGTLVATSLVICVLPLCFRLLLCRAGFSLVATMAEILGDAKSGGILREAASLLELLLAMLALIGVVFVLFVGVFAASAVT